MSTNVTFNGVQYSVPAYGDIGYAQGAGNLSAYLISIASGALQQTGGNFTLTSDVNFGPTYGLLAAYYKSRTANPAASGILRLANNSDAVSWRNATNTADLPLKVNALNHLEFNGVEIESNTLTSGHIFVGNASNESTDVAMTGDVSITNTGLTAIANAVVTGKLITGYVSGAGTVFSTDSILQAIQKLNGNDLLKLPLAGGTMTGDLTMSLNKAVIFNDNQGTPAQVTLKAPATVTSSYTLKFPTTAGTNTYVLATDGSGNLSWVPNGTGVVGTGAQYQIPYYASAGTTLSPATTINFNASGDFEILSGKNLQLDGATSGNVKVKAAATTTSYSTIMPNAQGTGVLLNDGAGNLSWASQTSVNQYVRYVVGTASGSYTGSTTVYDLPFSYQTDGKSIEVYYNGQQLNVTTDYTETSTTRVTTTSALVVGGAIWFRTITPGSIAAAVTNIREDYVVGTALNNYTGSTTVFNLVNSYNVGGNVLVVTLDGDVQTKGASIDYLETNSTTVTFNNALVTGQKVSFLWAQTAGSTPVNSGTANQVAYYAATGGVVSGSSVASVGANGLLAASGAEATPSISFSAATGTGLYTTGGNTLRISTGGVNNATITTTAITLGLPTAITGTTTNDSAAAGYVGELVENTGTSASITPANVTSISLTAGDWLVMGGGSTAGAVTIEIGISLNSASFTGTTVGSSRNNGACDTAGGIGSASVYRNIKLSSTTTVYLVGDTPGNPRTITGAISARRVR